MTEPLTRQDVERSVLEEWFGAPISTNALVERYSAALLAMAECDHCSVDGRMKSGLEERHRCTFCRGTGLNQTALARGLKALRGEP